MDPSPWSHAQSWLSSLERYAFPRIGKMPVSEVSSADVLEILAPIWQVKPDMAGKLRQHMRAVLEWAVALFPVVAVSPSLSLLSFSPHEASPGGNFPRPSGDRLHP